MALPVPESLVFLAINAISFLKKRAILKSTFKINTKAYDTHATNVILFQVKKEILKNIFRINMKVSDFLVINVIILLLEQTSLRDIRNRGMRVLFTPATYASLFPRMNVILSGTKRMFMKALGFHVPNVVLLQHQQSI